MSSNIPTFLRFNDAGTQLVKFAFDFITEADYMAYKTANGVPVPVFVSNDAVWAGPTPWGLLIANSSAQTIIQVPTPSQIAAGYVLAANGSWIAGGGGGGPSGPAGSNTQIQFNDSGTMNAVSGLVYDKTTSTLQVLDGSGGVAVNSTMIRFANLTVVTATLNSTSYSGTAASANNASYLGTIAAASYALLSGLAANVATMSANNASYLGGTIASSYALNSTLGAYQTTAGLAANVATLSANNSAYLGGVIASGYQTTAGLAANVATLTANNSAYLGGVIASSYLTSVPAAYVQNTDSRTLSGNLFFTASNVAFGNSTAYASINSSGYFYNGTAYTPNPPAAYVQNTDSRTLSGNLNFTGANVQFSALYLGTGMSMNTTTWWSGNSTVNSVSNSTTDVLQTAASILTITASTFSMGNSTANASGNSTSESLANSTSTLILTPAWLTVGNSSVNSTVNSTFFNATANNALNLGGVAASGYETKAALSGDVAQLGANSANYLGSIFFPNYVVNTDSRTLSGNLFFTGSNVAFGNSTQYLVVNSTGIYMNAETTFYGNSTVNSVVNSTAMAVSATSNTVQNSSGFYYNGLPVGAPSGNAVSFSVNKNSVDQTVTNATSTKITWSTKAFDLGGYFDTTLSRWTPPAGVIALTATVWGKGGGANPVAENIYIYKNGSPYRANFETVTAEQGPTLSIIDYANGTDYYEAWVNITGGVGGAPAVSGNPLWTHFEGSLLGVSSSVSTSDAMSVIRNGAMDIWQRGATVSNTSIGTYFYGPDGFQVAYAGAASNVQRVTSPGTRSKYAARLTGNTSQTGMTLRMLSEAMAASRVAGKNATFQVTIKNGTGAALTPTLTVNYANADDNFSSTTGVLAATNLQTIGNLNTGTVAYTFAVPAAAKSGLEFILSFGAQNANTKTVDVTEVDCQATPYLSVGLQTFQPVPSFLDPAAEQVRSQRYLYPLAVGGAGSGVLPASVCQTTTTTIDATIVFSAPMRATPTVLVGTQPTWQASTPTTGNAVAYYQYGTGFLSISGSLTVSFTNQNQSGGQLRYQASTSFPGTPGTAGGSFIGAAVNLLASAEF